MANVIVINPFEVPKGKEGQALEMWDTNLTSLSTRLCKTTVVANVKFQTRRES
jgi:hypothetical protein